MVIMAHMNPWTVQPVTTAMIEYIESARKYPYSPTGAHRPRK